MSLDDKIIFQSWDSKGNGEVEFSYDLFVKNLLLYEKIVLKTISFREIRYLLKIFGFNGVRDLLNNADIQLFQFANTVGQTRGEHELNRRDYSTGSVYGPFKFVLVTESLEKRDENLRLHLNESIWTINNISKRKKRKLEESIVESLLPVPEEYGRGYFNSFVKEIESNSESIKKAVIKRFREKRSIEIEYSDLILKAHRINEEEFEIESNIENFVDLEPLEICGEIQRGILRVGGSLSKFELMNQFDGLTYFNDDEVSILDDKYKMVVDLNNGRGFVDQVDRIITLRDFPKVTEFSSIKIDKVLKARSSADFVEFRKWLSSIEKKEDIEVYEELESFKYKVAKIYNSKLTEVIRFAISSGVGVIDTKLGVGLGLVDKFIVSKLFSKTGPVAYLDKNYPKIFDTDLNK